MLALALDTTAEFGSVALADSQATIEEALVHAPAGFSGVLFGQIEALLARHKVSLRDIDLFAAASGPGSFTGVRIGLAAVKGMGEALAKPAVAVSSLEVLATLGSADLRVAVIDARRGEVYAGAFDASGRAVLPESVLKFPSLLQLLAGRDFEWVSNHFNPFRPAVAGTAFEKMPVISAPRAMAADIARIAIRRMASGATGDPALIEANYVRRPDAELFWKG